MPTLWNVELTASAPRYSHGPVKSVKAAAIGHLCRETQELVSPDLLAVRECLPHQYRKAFDRAGHPWFNKYDNAAPATLTLRDARGRYLNTLVLRPYVFNA